MMIYRNQKGPADLRGGNREGGQSGYPDGFRRLIYPFQLLARIICRDAR
jgi:hypothetical protein